MARVLPVGNAPVTSPFLGGYRSTGGHGGTDYGVPAGTRVAAAAAGRVVFSGWDGPYGWRVVIDHGDGTTTAYNHLQAKGASVGQVLEAGQLVGNVGSTGNSTGPHLDFEVTINGRQVNPEEWLAGATTLTPFGAVPDGGMGQSFATTIQRTGVRITPVQPDNAWQSPTQVDITAAESRFGYAANESRFGMVAEEARSIGEAISDAPEGEGMGLGDVEWQSIEGMDFAGGAPSTGQGARPGGDYLSREEIAALAQQAGFSPEEARIAANIAVGVGETSGESGGYRFAYNGEGADESYGLMQMNLRYNDAERRRRMQSWGISNTSQLYDPLTNLRAAYALYKEQGWGAWTVARNLGYA